MNGRLWMALALAFSLLLPCLSAAGEAAESSLYVKKVENLPEDFIFGMDVSSVLAEEASGVKYHDFDGSEADLFRVLADSGINMIRVRSGTIPMTTGATASAGETATPRRPWRSESGPRPAG